MAVEAECGYGRSRADPRILPDGWDARLLAHVRAVVVVVGLAAIPFGADLACNLHARSMATVALAPAMSGAAVATALETPAP